LRHPREISRSKTFLAVRALICSARSDNQSSHDSLPHDIALLKPGWLEDDRSEVAGPWLREPKELL
jgi:hypothetical protein